MTTGGVIAVHIGAGYHSPTKEGDYKRLCKVACAKGIDMLQSSASSLVTLVSVMKILEDDPLTNAGSGSNLTLHGTVECDASIMDGKGRMFGAVGALQGIKNPIEAANCLLGEQLKGKLSMGRVPPCFLVSNGARQFARDHGIKEALPGTMTTENALKSYKKYKRQLSECSVNHEAPSAKKRQEESCLLMDTVGAICLDTNGNISSAVSSGGIVLKHPGRVGHAAMFGCGCWSENVKDDKVGIACSTTGCGEQIMRTNLAQKCCQNVQAKDNPIEAVQETFTQDFKSSQLLCNDSEKLGGALLVSYDQNNAELVWAHTTESMCFGYMSTRDKSPKVKMSRLPSGSKCGESLCLGGCLFKLS
ncbi:threonine aspartase 1-like [Anneissia japonica]|uniref:threonine aspartase 1-like n=1 Tax=Anneissia japonica TaxID=1529436 RepID=UPI00142568BF|nr:threonine aspartase 1-like [Anneissia japonica]